MSMIDRTFDNRFASIVGALALSLGGIAATVAPVQAEARGAERHVAQLAAPTDKARFIERGVVWDCDGTTCTATRKNSRDWVACKRLAQKVGPVASFTTGGKALSAEELEKCNG